MESKFNVLALTPLALALASTSAFAANRVELSRLDVNALNHRYAASVASTGAPTMNHSRHELLLGVEQDSFLVMQSSNRSGGSVNRRYVQTFRGLPIYGENLVVSEDAHGNVKALFGRKVDGLAREIGSTRPKLSKDQALAAAKAAALGPRTVVSNIKVDLQIYIDPQGKAYLAYAVDFVADTAKRDMLSRPMVVVDANTGRILFQYENLQTELVGTGPGGNQKTGQYEYGSNGRAYLDVTKSGSTCSLENANAKTIDATGAPFNASTAYFDYSKAAYSFVCPRNTYKTVNGGYSPLNDVHYFGSVVMQMYIDWTGASPLTTKLNSAVHYGTSWENAAWNGTGMVYGDGASTFYPLTNLDVTGHEISHGFTNQNSNLGPYYGSQAGCMNEAYSDMSGEASEFYDHGSNDWIVGQEIFKSADTTKGLRYFDDPTRDGRSIANAGQYNTSIDPHLCSGVYNKAFYTLARKAGWTTKTAWQSFQRANRDYWTSNATFNTGATGVLKAACDLGFNGQDVIDSFALVGVNAGALPAGCGGAPANQAPTANFTASANGLTVTFTDTSTDSDGSIASRSWNFGDGTTSTSTNPSKTYSAAGTYTVTLTVTDNGGLTSTKTQSVTVTSSGGNVLSNGVAQAISGAQGSSQVFTLSVPAGATNLKFVTSGGSGDADLYVKFNATPSTTSYDCKSEGSTTAETCNITTAQAGTYYVLIKGYTAFSGASLTGSYTTGSSAQTYSNTTDYSIPDTNATGISSPITVSGRSGTAPSNASISVNIVHTYVGDLRLDLIAPDGSVYNLRSNTGGSADNIVETYTRNLSTEALNGTWKLRVIDNAAQDVGYINSWSITF